MVLQVSNSSAGNANIGVRAGQGTFNQASGCSMEQIFSPIEITKDLTSRTPGMRQPSNSTYERGPFGLGAGPTSSQNDGGVGPTSYELNPYFPNIFGLEGKTQWITNADYNTVVCDELDDLNLKLNNNRAQAYRLRTQGLRGPLMLSGWGFAINDLPANHGQDRRNFIPNIVNQRSYWKTGPVDLRWDDERQVWTGNPHQILVGYLCNFDGNTSNPSPQIYPAQNVKNPSAFFMRVLRENNQGALDETVGEVVQVVNRDSSLEYDGDEPERVFIVAVRVNYEYVPLWVGCPDKIETSSSSRSSSGDSVSKFNSSTSSTGSTTSSASSSVSSSPSSSTANSSSSTANSSSTGSGSLGDADSGTASSLSGASSSSSTSSTSSSSTSSSSSSSSGGSGSSSSSGGSQGGYGY